MPPSAAALAAHRAVMQLKKNRKQKAANIKRSKIAALPRVPRVFLNANYVNPVTLNFPAGFIVYEVQNKRSGRTNYYDKETFWKLIKAYKNDYNLLMANPKLPIPGVRNPATRGAIYPRNIRRVIAVKKKKTPNRNTAARKIQSVVRKHLSKKSKSRSR